MIFLLGNLLPQPLVRQKIFRAMKLITFLIFSGIMQLNAAVYSQNTFTMNESRATVREMFRKIEKTSHYTIFYRQDQVKLDQQVNVLAENSPIETVMKQVLQDQPLTFEVMENMVIIKPLATESAQQGTISGTITDEKGEPLIGASVLVKGTTSGASTDVQGRFTLRVTTTGNVTLVVKYIGFQPKEVAAQVGQNGLKIALNPEASALSEVVVIGYGTVRRRDLTGAVTSVKSEDITRIPTHNPVEAIQGRVPGADITRGSGRPGSAPNIIVRGNRSIANNDDMASRNGPLYVIDGIQGGSINDLNPNDIESIEVLKDASSTAIYGALGANGVIIVTTKKGTSGQAKVSYSGYYGVSDYQFPKARTGEEYLALRREAYRKDDTRTGGQFTWTSPSDDQSIFSPFPGEWEAYQAGQWVDWVDLLTKSGSQQSHALTVTGGSEKTKVFASAGYFNEEGMLRNEDYNRYNARFNLDQTINKWMKVGVQSQFAYSKQNQRDNPLSQAITISPLGLPYDENGLVNINPIAQDRNKVSPLADERTPYIASYNTIRSNIITNGYLELTPVKGLTIRSNFGANLTSSRQGIYRDKTSINRYNVGTPYTSSESVFDRNFTWDNIVTYKRDIEEHSVTLTGISSYIQSDRDVTSASGINQTISSPLYYGLGFTSADGRLVSSPYTGSNNIAYAGRLNYSYKGKYLLTMTGRFDGASRLASGNKWDFFPSAAIGWNVSDEAFMKGIEQISNLKLRASYGISGNYSIPVYGTQSQLIGNSTMSFGNQAAYMFQFSSVIGNPNLGWEKSGTLDIGLDLSLLRNRISLTADWYRTVTSDILLPRSLPWSTGVSTVYENIGETQNKGVELALTSRNIEGKDFKWSSTLTFSRNREKITKLIDGNNILASDNIEENSLLLGRPIQSFYTYKKLGIWQTWEAEEARKYTVGGRPFEPGDIKVADLDGDYIINPQKDVTYIGSRVPDWIAGFQNNFSYKAFDLSFYLFARYGQMIDAEFLGRYNPSGAGNSPAILNYWTPENPTNDYPRPRAAASINSYPGYTGYQALTYVDGSYLKLRNLTVGYTLPKNAAKKLMLDNVRIYATGTNLLVFTKNDLIKDYDPERGGSESAPLSRQWVFGVNFGF
ncbi:SusC/RagA family TonB-linked outer membrane protein [Pararcticibacter amylolyticus]|uniref:SusC/RagA family TonB-linked outer membrane protein n=2 Tax=Pararcticibacter amylolyticus TaxID=2173175 RepID=A0A2U2PF15_9SPHI|nr:SusC/RagA family TonB-linked outer membrane protein [Pararcticibacter amylolyticus]